MTCQVFNYHLIHSRKCPPLLCLTRLRGALLLWRMHYSVQQFLVSECWSKTPFPVSDSFIQMWQLWGSCRNAPPPKVWVDYEIQRDKGGPVDCCETPESFHLYLSNKASSANHVPEINCLFQTFLGVTHWSQTVNDKNIYFSCYFMHLKALIDHCLNRAEQRSVNIVIKILLKCL